MSYVDKFKSTVNKYDIVDLTDIDIKKKEVYYYNLIINSEKQFCFEGDYDTIHFVCCYFKNGIVIRNGNFGIINFTNCYIDGDLEFYNVVGEKEVLLFHAYVKKGLSFHSCKIEEVDCNLHDVHGIDFKYSSFNSFELIAFEKNCENLSFKHVEGSIEISGADFKEISIIGGKSDASFFFDGIRCVDFYVNSLKNIDGLKLFNFESIKDEESKFSIYDSYLGKAEFYDVDFESFNTVTIARTHLTDCSFIDVDWNFEMNKSNDLNNDEYSSRETFRQLKYALGKQGDTINEQKFHTLEMRAHYKSLDWDTDFWNKAIIWLSYNTSNFGQSIWWPIRALLVGHSFLFFIAMLAGMASVHISTTNPSWSGFNTAVYQYFFLINPLHKTEELPKDWTIIIDIFMRIWSSYMIYNIIRASRRFIK